MKKVKKIEYYKELYKNHAEARKTWKLEIFEDEKGIHIYEKKKKKDIGWHLQYEIKNENGIIKITENHDFFFKGYQYSMVESDLAGRTKRYLSFYTIFDYRDKGIESFIGDATNFEEYKELRYSQDGKWTITRTIENGCEEFVVLDNETEENYKMIVDFENMGFDLIKLKL